jgi:Family of unknown function (DUF6496)
VPEKRTMEQARKALRSGKRPTTAAGAFVREEMEHAKRGKHPVKSRKQAIAIGLSKARRAGLPLPPRKGRRTRPSAAAARRAGGGRKTGGGPGRGGASRRRTRR